MTCFLPDLQISQVHGQPKRIKVKYKDNKLETLVILPLYHPAAALYNGAMRQTLIDDFSRIPEIINLIRQAK
jgi:uracil-DNA glycosylase